MEKLVLWHRLGAPTKDEDDETGARAEWIRRVEARMQAEGGVPLATVGSSIAAAFDVALWREVFELALSLLDEGERQHPVLPVSLGAAVGSMAAIDRAALLAHRARPGELVLDPVAVEHASREFLFSRQVGTGSSQLRGQAVDRDHPRRGACGPAMGRLQPPPVPDGARTLLERFKRLVNAGGTRVILLRGTLDAAATEWVETLSRELGHPVILRLHGVPGALEPLGSLRYALLRAWRSPDGVVAALRARGISETSADHLGAIAGGRAVQREATVAAMGDFIAAHSDGQASPWLLLEPLPTLDPATIDIVAEALERTASRCALVARLPVDAQVPPPLRRIRQLDEVTLPRLRSADARQVAQQVLGPRTREDVARRVATLGGSSPLGVVEAARALIAAGDLVLRDDAYTWRVAPRGGATAVPVESLLEERLAPLASTTHRVLEAVCCVPSGAPNPIIAAVSRADGLRDTDVVHAIDALRAEALIETDDPWTPTSGVLRGVVMHSMPPARASELYRFFAGAMAAADHGRFAAATRGYCWAEGGQEQEGASLILKAGHAALSAGFTQSAVRLAATAVQLDPSPETRLAAARISRAAAKGAAVDGQRSRPSDLAAVAVDGILRQDFDKVDRAIDLAIADGRDRAAAERVRAMGHLARGDLSAARKALARSQTAARLGPTDSPSSIRAALAQALVRLYGGDRYGGVCAALTALATARATEDRRGEAAARHALRLCLRREERPSRPTIRAAIPS